MNDEKNITNDANIDLINKWILEKLFLMQKEYIEHQKKWEINLITNKLIQFGKEILSQQYLELIKPFFWNSNTKKTLLFVYQRLLIMLHPVAPSITDFIYQKITNEKILQTSINFNKDDTRTKNINSDLWQVDCCLLIISTIRNLQKKKEIDYSSKLFLELTNNNNKKIFFDFNKFIKPLTNNEITVIKELIHSKDITFVPIMPFGNLLYQQKNEITKLKEQLCFFEKEYYRSKCLLDNKDFIRKAPNNLVKKEEEKFFYYSQEKEKIEKKIEDFLREN